ncbi:MAG: hypothetical protein K0A93_12815 [Desulfuromonadaceae bacterium]|nr:hypothetical protein [Desulfuromonadaceae bacterium]
MKKFLVLMAAAAMVTAGASMALAATANDGLGIQGSSHDFSDNVNLANKAATAPAEGWNNRQEICRVCHAPHDKGRTTYTNGLLWNHKTSDLTFTMYSNQGGFTSLDGTVDAQPTGSSKLCLSCHDGATNIDAFDNKQALGTITIAAYENASLNQGASTGHLEGNHPISITYEEALDGELNVAATTFFADGSSIAKVLEDGKVQCASCHDVHNKGTAAGSSLLRSPNTLDAAKGGDGTSTASALCLTCHNK